MLEQHDLGGVYDDIAQELREVVEQERASLAEMAREASGHQVVPWLQPLLEQAQMSAQLALEEAYESKLSEGRALTTASAIEMILERFHTPEVVGA